MAKWKQFRRGEKVQRRFNKHDVEDRAKQMATDAGFNPLEIVEVPGLPSRPRWRFYSKEAKAALGIETIPVPMEQPEVFSSHHLEVVGDHEQQTIDQMLACMKYGNVVGGVLCPDGHLGYAQSVGGVIGYEGQISISGVGFDIACGNQAVRLDTTYRDVKDRLPTILNDINGVISFGVTRRRRSKVSHELFDDSEAWHKCDMDEYRVNASRQLGTVGSGNHYVDVFVERIPDKDLDDCPIWIGVHFGSRGFGHRTATRYLFEAGGVDGINAPPAIINENSELGIRYISGMELAGRYAYAGREWVTERVRRIIGGKITKNVHNHHNFAWRERHFDRDLWVVRKGATPAFPGQEGFVGGSMGDDAVITEGLDTEKNRRMMYSTIHGAGRLFSRNAARNKFSREEMDRWLSEQGVLLLGADLDESPMAYRRLNDVLSHCDGATKVNHVLKPLLVAMAGKDTLDPWKD